MSLWATAIVSYSRHVRRPPSSRGAKLGASSSFAQLPRSLQRPTAGSFRGARNDGRRSSASLRLVGATCGRRSWTPIGDANRGREWRPLWLQRGASRFGSHIEVSIVTLAQLFEQPSTATTAATATTWRSTPFRASDAIDASNHRFGSRCRQHHNSTCICSRLDSGCDVIKSAEEDRHAQCEARRRIQTSTSREQDSNETR